jgi:hypothetical protein
MFLYLFLHLSSRHTIFICTTRRVSTFLLSSWLRLGSGPEYCFRKGITYTPLGGGGVHEGGWGGGGGEGVVYQILALLRSPICPGFTSTFLSRDVSTHVTCMAHVMEIGPSNESYIELHLYV